MVKDLDTYLKELQVSMATSGADRALIQDALFDAEEYLRAEMAERYEGEPSSVEDYRTRFVAVAEDYGTPEEVAAAYLGRSSTEVGLAEVAAPAPGGAGMTPGAIKPVVPQSPVAPVPPAQPAAPTPPSGPSAPAGRDALADATVPVGVAAGAAAAAAESKQPSVWRQVFGVVVDPAVYKALVYMLFSLATGIVYFTVVVTGVATAGGMLVLIVGIPLFLLVLGIVRGMALVESQLVEALLGTRMPRRERSGPPGGKWSERIVFWVKDGRTWASMAYMILMLPLGILYFTIAVTGISAGFGLMGAPFVYWIRGEEFIWHGFHHTFTVPLWTTPFGIILGIVVLVAWLHLIRWMGRGHAAFAKSMLVRLSG